MCDGGSVVVRTVRRLAVLALPVLLVGTGCTEPSPGMPGPASTSAPRPSAPRVDPAEERIRSLAARGREVAFRTGDGVELRGLVFGDGPTAVVLSHMGSAGRNLEDWLPAVDRLAAPGRTVLLYNRRGNCSPVLEACSEGVDDMPQSWRDVAAAGSFVRGLGARKVVLAGASLGAMATFDAVARHDVAADGLVWVAGVLDGEFTFDRAAAEALPRVPILYLSTADDGFGAGPATRTMAAWTGGRSTLEILPGTLHGTDLLGSFSDEPTREAFLSAVDALVAAVQASLRVRPRAGGVPLRFTRTYAVRSASLCRLRP